MSFLLGPVSGALVAGGVYYGFAQLIQTRTEKHRRDLMALNKRISQEPTVIPNAPIPAAERIKTDAFSSNLKASWNHEIAKLFVGFQQLDKTLVASAKSLLYGPSAESTGRPKITGQGVLENVKEAVLPHDKKTNTPSTPDL